MWRMNGGAIVGAMQFAAEMQPGSPSHATYNDPWADPDAYLSLISRMHGHEVALGIKEIMDGIIANEDHMKSLIQQVLLPPMWWE